MFDKIAAYEMGSGMIVGLDNDATPDDERAWFHVERVSFDRDECAFIAWLRPLYISRANGKTWCCDSIDIENDSVFVRYDRESFDLDD